MPYKNLEDKKQYNKEYSKKNKEIIRQVQKEYRKNNYQKLRPMKKEWYEENKKRVNRRRRFQKLKRDYNLSIEDFVSLGEFQNWSCAICYKTFEPLSTEINVDHEHITGKVRGLLCRNCNTGLGQFKDNITNLKQAIWYLDKSCK